ncbi:hypothetical protein CERSUDRAFT_113236 [Gelatoporia subvermispora B]|uniref:Protein kinase domain-containing protein n=1 Tax=Ceriporiopsis subvermispora (strain B) TaxID=914234 RepID=M2RH13_CERS8|nr:hypothetical protein CERSUDRAFT_113236 [Gelatoporia subvermispora B]
MAQRRPHHRISSVPDTAILTRRKIQSRRGAASRRRVFTLSNKYVQSAPDSHGSVASSSPHSSPRPVLVPLQFNLRRLPSRSLLSREGSMRDASGTYDVPVGSKRKRVASGNENAASGRGSRASSRVKRRRAMQESSDEGTSSEMEVDKKTWELSDNSGDEDALDSSENHLINEASARQLLRLRKDELLRLYTAAGLTDNADLFTKNEIVDSIIAARDDIAELPPSSPGVADSNSSDYSSDGGNVAGGEETDFAGRFRAGLRRRATMHDLGRGDRRHMPDRSLSMGQLEHRNASVASLGKRTRTNSDATNGLTTRKRGVSNASSSRSSSTTSVTQSLPSPPATRLRTRKVSDETQATLPVSISKGKGKGKQVEFSENVEINDAPPIAALDDESDLTDLTEIEEKLHIASPSPRRLRSKKERSRASSSQPEDEAEKVSSGWRRVTPMRKAKSKPSSAQGGDDEDEEDQLESTETEEEVDELTESPSPLTTPKAPGRRTPVKRRLRPRHIQTHTPPSDGDDEHSDDEAEEEEVEEDDDEGDDEETVADDEEPQDEVLSEPRVLRSGKIVGEEEMDEDIGEEDEDEEDEEEDPDFLDSTEEIEMDAEVDAELSEEAVDADEAMEDDVDLTIATAKTLVRMRRDDLVRLCETRDIDPSGTKPQLAEALLQWRDRHCSEAATSSPSSTGTARPPSTARYRPGRRKTRSNDSQSQTPPVLERSDRVHLDEPRTPPLSGRAAKEAEPELELNLENLGLEDREIPPEKLTKLEKIGSGGFKDVFIGKFRGRKVAIAEFRGQLSAMDIKELKLLGDFNHPNIVRFLGVSIPENTKETPVMIVSELCSNGDLFDYIRNVHAPSLYRVLCIMLDIARGLEYLHTRKPSVIHRDCKSSNILITSKGVAKITDFGLAKVKQSTRSMMRSVVGTVNWQAPELWHPSPKYNHKVDVFSCAMVYWEVLQWHVPNKKFPWEGMNEHAIYDIVGNKRQRPSVSSLRKQWCPEIVDLIERMWAHEHQDRPSMTEVVEELQELVQKYR